MTGRRLRGKLEEISETMDLVEEFMEDHNLLTEEVSKKIQYIRELSEELFYSIPLPE